MSGVPGDEQVKNDFIAARGAATRPNDDWMRQAASQQTAGGSAPAAQSGSPALPSAAARTAPPPADPSSTPLGLRFDNWMSSAASGGAKTFTGDVEGAWNKLKTDFLATAPDPKKFRDASALDQARQQFDALVNTGKVPLDAISLALSPMTGAVHAVLAKPLAAGERALITSLPGGNPKNLPSQAQMENDITNDVFATGPVKGEGAIAAEGAEAVKPANPDGAPPGGAAPNAADAVAGSQDVPPAAENAAGVKPPPPEEPPGGAAPNAGAKAADQTEKPTRAFDIAGEQPGADLKVTPELRDQAARYLKGDTPDNPIQASLSTMARDPDLTSTLEDVAKFIPKDSIKPDDVLRLNAYSLGMTPDQILNTGLGKLPDDEHMLAWNMLMNSGAQQLKGLAQKAIETGAPEDNEAFVRAYTLQNKLVGDWSQAGTAVARTFRARQLAEGARSDYTQTIQDIIKNADPENIDEVKRKIAGLDDPKQVTPLVSWLRRMTSRDGLLYGFYNLKLSNPRTILKKITSDGQTMAWNVATTYASEKLGSGVQAGETGALINGYIGAWGDAFRIAGKALKSGESQFEGEYQTADGRVSTRLQKLAAGIDPSVEPTVTHSGMEYLRAAAPTSWMAAADDWAKVMNYRAELRRLAYRQGVSKDLAGDALSQHINDTITAPPDALHTQAVDAALRNTFQEPLSTIGSSIQNIADSVNIPIPKTGVEIPIGRMVLPFVRIPANIPRFVARQTPIGFLMPSVRAELAAGGAQRSLAYARMGLGTGVSMTGLGLYGAGRLTGGGPSDPQMQRAWRAAGNEPYSVMLGGKWYGYRNLEPFGTMLGAVADTADVMRYAHGGDGIAWSLAFGVGNAMLSKTYLQQFSDFLDALHSPDREAAHFGDTFAANTIEPAALTALKTASDPWLRAHYSFLDQVASKTAGLSYMVPKQQDLWGRDIKLSDGFMPGTAVSPDLTGSGLARAISPVPVSEGGHAEPIDKWIWDNRATFPEADQGRLGITKPGLTQNFDGGGKLSTQVQFTPQQLHKFRSLAGNGLKDPNTGLGAMDYLNSLVKGNNPDDTMQERWNNAAPAARALMVLSAVNKFRSAAKSQMLNNDMDLRSKVATGLGVRKDQLTGATANAGAPVIDGASP